MVDRCLWRRRRLQRAKGFPKIDPTMKERVVLVTGASRGIGKAIAEKFAQRGDRVFGTTRQPESVKWAAGTLLPLDVQDERSVAQCVESLLSQANRIDVLVNNAGISVRIWSASAIRLGRSEPFSA
jgi:NAD(P)-dependent dehydrogenase (short-subunit alcohol dehydrogenase family)